MVEKRSTVEGRWRNAPPYALNRHNGSQIPNEGLEKLEEANAVTLKEKNNMWKLHIKNKEVATKEEDVTRSKKKIATQGLETDRAHQVHSRWKLRRRKLLIKNNVFAVNRRHVRTDLANEGPICTFYAGPHESRDLQPHAAIVERKGTGRRV